jgi:hypothetical protein
MLASSSKQNLGRGQQVNKSILKMSYGTPKEGNVFYIPFDQTRQWCIIILYIEFRI